MLMWRGMKDFQSITRGLRRDIDQELLVVGGLKINQGSIQMRNPQLVIGSDRLELYEFFARRKETWSMQNRDLVKACVALTAVHFLLVRVPEMFSRYFGDEVGSTSQKLGAQD
jgi:hypothetical protein